MRPLPILALTLLLTACHKSPAPAPPALTLEFELANPKADITRELAVVRQRLVPFPQATVTQTSSTHLSILIPSTENLQHAQAARDAAMDAFRKTELTPARLESLLKLPPADRDSEFDAFAPADTPLHDPLHRLAQAFDAGQRLKRAADTAPGAAADAAALIGNDAYFAAFNDVCRIALHARELAQTLAAANDPANPAARPRRDALLLRDPAQATEILHAIDAEKNWLAAGGTLQNDPREITALLECAGTLEFRAAVTRISDADLRKAVQSLRLHGPAVAVVLPAMNLRWFEIDPASRANFPEKSLCYDQFNGRTCVLCYNDHINTLTHGDPLDHPWSAPPRPPETKPDGRISLPFNFDATALSCLDRLHDQTLVTLVDNQALSAAAFQ